MIRALAATLSVAMVASAAYLPAVTAPAAYLTVVAHERAQATATWGAPATLAALAFALRGTATPAWWPPSVAPTAPRAAPGAPVQAGAIALAGVQARVADSVYARAWRAQGMLARLRLALMLHAAATLWPCFVALLIDALVARYVTTASCQVHDPARCAAAAAGTLLVVGGAVVLGLLPVVLPVWMVAAVPVLGFAFASRAFANYPPRR